jgi:hypothetical protein
VKGFNLKRGGGRAQDPEAGAGLQRRPVPDQREVEKTDNVFPMIPAGKPLEDMIMERRTKWRNPPARPDPNGTATKTKKPSNPSTEKNAESTDCQHTISVYVANKPGVLARIAQVFARRGYNIESLVVSPVVDGTSRA